MQAAPEAPLRTDDQPSAHVFIDRAKLRALRSADFLATWNGVSSSSIAATRSLLEAAVDGLAGLSDASSRNERAAIIRDAVGALNAANDGFICTLEREDICDFLVSVGTAAGLDEATVDDALEERDW